MGGGLQPVRVSVGVAPRWRQEAERVVRAGAPDGSEGSQSGFPPVAGSCAPSHQALLQQQRQQLAAAGHQVSTGLVAPLKGVPSGAASTCTAGNTTASVPPPLSASTTLLSRFTARSRRKGGGGWVAEWGQGVVGGEQVVRELAGLGTWRFRGKPLRRAEECRAWRHPMGCSSASAIDLAAMAKAHHQDHQFAALPFVDHAVVAHP